MDGLGVQMFLNSQGLVGQVLVVLKGLYFYGDQVVVVQSCGLFFFRFYCCYFNWYKFVGYL